LLVLIDKQTYDAVDPLLFKQLDRYQLPFFWQHSKRCE